MMRSSLRSARQRAFTLVEILIVVAIIGILAAILLPVFNSARESARQATCSNNLKQIYLGTQLYLQDSNGTYPYLIGLGPTCGWANLIYPYTKSTQVFECPNVEYGEFKAGCPPESADGKHQWDGSYQINILRTGSRQFIREANVGRPSQVILFKDGSATGITPGIEVTPYGYKSLEEWMDTLSQTSLVHREGWNLCFADGHIKWMRFDGPNATEFWLNDRDAGWGK